MSLPDPQSSIASFDLGEPVAAPPTVPQAAPTLAAPAPQPAPSWIARMKSRGGIAGTLASLALLIAKILAPLKIALLFLLKFKFLITIVSMGVSIWLEARAFGLPLAVGLVAMIFIHECGHAFAARRLGHKTSGMIFIPFMGAAVFTRGRSRSVVEDAYIGIMGPIFGTGVGVIYYLIYSVTGLPVFLALASITFIITLFNLLPTPPLDGGWITPVFSSKFLAVGMVLLLFIGLKNPFILLLALMSLPRVISGWKATPQNNPYFAVTARDRWVYGVFYFGLAAALALGWNYTHVIVEGLRHTQVLHQIS